MTNIPVLEDIVPAEELDAMKLSIETETIKLVEEKLFPIIRKTVQFEGEVHATAKATFALDVIDGTPTVKNNVTVGLDFGAVKRYDIIAEVERTLFTEVFNIAITKYM